MFSYSKYTSNQKEKEKNLLIPNNLKFQKITSNTEYDIKAHPKQILDSVILNKTKKSEKEKELSKTKMNLPSFKANIYYEESKKYDNDKESHTLKVLTTKEKKNYFEKPKSKENFSNYGKKYTNYFDTKYQQSKKYESEKESQTLKVLTSKEKAKNHEISKNNIYWNFNNTQNESNLSSIFGVNCEKNIPNCYDQKYQKVQSKPIFPIKQNESEFSNKFSEFKKQSNYKENNKPNKIFLAPVLQKTSLIKATDISTSKIYRGEIIELKRIGSTEPLKIKILKRLFKGKTSDIYKCETFESKAKEIALKRFKDDEGLKLGRNEKKILEKISKLKSLKDCKTLCKIYGFSEDLKHKEYKFNLALEFGKETLYETLQKKKFNMSEIKDFAINMIFVFSHFQKIGLFYRDIKPANILDNKIIDFDVALCLDEVKCDKNGNYEINLSGTPKYMAPELYKIYNDFRNEKEDEFDKNSLKKLIHSNLQDQIDIPNEFIDDEEKTLTITKKQLKTDNENIHNVVNASDCFKSDVFSLGLVFLEMALSFQNPFIKETSAMIGDANKSQKNLEIALENFKKIKKSSQLKFLDNLVSKMVKWEKEFRLDFIELEDYMIYNELIEFENSFKYAETDQKFTSLRTFRNIWDINDLPSMNKFFFSAGYLAKAIDKNFIRTILTLSFEDNTVGKSIAELKKYNINTLPFQNPSIQDVCGIITKCYTAESDFYKELNKSLGQNKIENFKYTLFAFLKSKYTITKPISQKFLYRVISLPSDNTKWKFEARNQYFPKMDYYWPSFTSTTKSQKVCESWYQHKSLQSPDLISFLIAIDNTNLLNKADISSLSYFKEEEEVLLFPYFHFRVISNSPRKIQVGCVFKTICEIKVEEIKENIINFSVLWCDPNVNSNENKQLADSIRHIYGNIFFGFTEISELMIFLKKKDNEEKNFIVISCGKFGEKLLKEFQHYENIIQFILYVGNKKYHEEWTKKYLGLKLKGVYDLPDDVLKALPDKNLFC